MRSESVDCIGESVWVMMKSGGCTISLKPVRKLKHGGAVSCNISLFELTIRYLHNPILAV